MPWIVTGSCVNCGACCKPPVVVDNPCIELAEDRCKFYSDTPEEGRLGQCLIIWRGNKPIKNVHDRFDNKITDEQIAWFNANCPQFPMANLQELVDGAFELPEDCDYSIEEV